MTSLTQDLRAFMTQVVAIDVPPKEPRFLDTVMTILQQEPFEVRHLCPGVQVLALLGVTGELCARCRTAGAVLDA